MVDTIELLKNVIFIHLYKLEKNYGKWIKLKKRKL